MKKAKLIPVLLALVIFGFTCGFLVGRNFNHKPLTVNTSAPTQPVTSEPESRKVNINTATAQELTLLPGVGNALAKRITEYREENGPFKRIEDLRNVSGIGERKLEDILEYITVGGGI